MRSVLVAILLLVAVPAFAAGPNGGATVVVDGHPIEFVGTDSEITFFVTEDDGTPARTEGLTAKAFVQAAGRTETIALAGASPNRLVGALKAPLPTGAKIVLSARLHGHTLQARFEK